MKNNLLFLNLGAVEILFFSIILLLLLSIPVFAIRNYFKARYLKDQNDLLKEQNDHLKELLAKK